MNDLRAEGHSEACVLWAVVESSLIIIRITIGRRALTVDQLDILCLLHNPLPTTLRAHWRRGAAQMQARFLLLIPSHTIRCRIIKLLAWSQTH
jgi:hypothetical protein